MGIHSIPRNLTWTELNQTALLVTITLNEAVIGKLKRTCNRTYYTYYEYVDVRTIIAEVGEKL